MRFHVLLDVLAQSMCARFRNLCGLVLNNVLALISDGRSESYQQAVRFRSRVKFGNEMRNSERCGKV
jgi:hypothetical protein